MAQCVGAQNGVCDHLGRCLLYTSLLLEAGIALALRGAGYENEAAADMVFKPRSSGGLPAAIEYACRLVA